MKKHFALFAVPMVHAILEELESTFDIGLERRHMKRWKHPHDPHGFRATIIFVIQTGIIGKLWSVGVQQREHVVEIWVGEGELSFDERDGLLTENGFRKTFEIHLNGRQGEKISPGVLLKPTLHSFSFRNTENSREEVVRARFRGKCEIALSDRYAYELLNNEYVHEPFDGSVQFPDILTAFEEAKLLTHAVTAN